MRARVFPRWTGILLIAAGIGFLLSFPPLPPMVEAILETVALFAFFLVFLWCGSLLIAPERGVAEQPASAPLASH
jgi:hypothetical protein